MTNIDSALKNNYLKRYKALFDEYELVKSGNHKHYRYAKQFYESNKIIQKTFLKYYNRYKQSGKDTDILPGKRGPKYKTRRTLSFIEEKIVVLRQKGNNRYEIYEELKPKLG